LRLRPRQRGPTTAIDTLEVVNARHDIEAVTFAAYNAAGVTADLVSTLQLVGTDAGQEVYTDIQRSFYIGCFAAWLEQREGESDYEALVTAAIIIVDKKNHKDGADDTYCTAGRPLKPLASAGTGLAKKPRKKHRQPRRGIRNARQGHQRGAKIGAARQRDCA
jgi:hypothetical protein